MNSSLAARGQCLCGKVEVHVPSTTSKVAACHCNMCRKWSGGPLLGVDCENAIDIVGEEYVSVYESSEWAERAFCSQCGTHLFYKLKKDNHYSVPAGLFNADVELKFNLQIFTDEKPGYYEFSNKTMNMTGAEIESHLTGN